MGLMALELPSPQEVQVCICRQNANTETECTVLPSMVAIILNKAAFLSSVMFL